MRVNRTILLSVASLVVLWAGWTAEVSAQPDLPNRPPPLPPSPVLTPSTPPKITRAAAIEEPAAEPAGAPEVVHTAEAPTGKQEPAVSLEWIGPATLRLGQPVNFVLSVKNTSSATVHGVVVRNRVPAGVIVKAAEPRAGGEGQILAWELGTLQAGQERRIQLQLVPEKKGDLDCQASVTFTGSTVARLKVREPKLVLKTTTVEKVMVGDPATLTLMISNPGDGVAEGVKVKTTLPDGLEHARGKVVEFELGSLAPNETRTVQLVCASKAGGAQKCETLALADGDLTATDEATVEVMLPKLDLVVTGPKLRYLDRQATYNIQVTNAGSAPVQNVTLSDLLPVGFKFLSATVGGRLDPATKSVSWFVGDLTPGQSREVSLTVLAVQPGEQKHKVTANAARGLKSESEAVTRVEGLSALLMELVDLDDPVEVGADTSYEIRVTNTGSKTETNLQLVCTVPDKMEFRGAKAPGGVKYKVQGKEVIFDVLPKLAPRADVVFKVLVRGAAPGDLRFRAWITADGLSDPVLKEESTKVYGE
jgi:uncharacterized repeat protein (TIGR01451 family)